MNRPSITPLRVNAVSDNGPTQGKNTPWQLTLLCKSNCPLCDEAKQAIEAFATEVDLSLQLVDITQNEDLWEQYQYDIPVLMINGEEAARHHIGVKKLRVLRRRWQEGTGFSRSAVFPAN